MYHNNIQNTFLFIHGNDLNIFYLLAEIYDFQGLKMQAGLCLCDSGHTRDQQRYDMLYLHCLPRSFTILFLTSYPEKVFSKFQQIGLLVTKSDELYLLEYICLISFTF
jgi:hypothetical protein